MILHVKIMKVINLIENFFMIFKSLRLYKSLKFSWFNFKVHVKNGLIVNKGD